MPFEQRLGAGKALPEGEPDETTEPPASSTKSPLNAFGLALLREECTLKPEANVFLSPLSIFLALAMTENGSAGETRAAMRRVLALPADAGDESLNQSAAALLKSLPSHEEAKLSIANALWLDTGSLISPDFVELSRRVYDATVRTLDLRRPSSAGTINDWVSSQTGGKIPGIVTPDGIAETSAILTNAVYFQAKFSIPFRKEATQPQNFFLPDGRTKLVPMMHMSMMHVGSLTGAYRSGGNFEAALLPYAGTRLMLYLLLPAQGSSPEQILTEGALQPAVVPGPADRLNLSLPRFIVSCSVDLRKSLTQMGMGIAFQNPGSDFSLLGSPPFCIGQVLHKSRLEVDEEGTVATAATAVLAVPTMARRKPAESKTLVFDRPFAVVVIDSTTGALVFVGIVREP
jgi:serine protease inhibitor